MNVCVAPMLSIQLTISLEQRVSVVYRGQIDQRNKSMHRIRRYVRSSRECLVVLLDVDSPTHSLTHSLSSFFQTGCLGCASGKGAGPRNIFGNKYGQNLAAVQIAREKRLEAKQKREIEKQRQATEVEANKADADDDDETDDEDDFGPAPVAGIWAGTKKLEKESERLAEHPDEVGDDETDDDDEVPQLPPAKKVKTK